LARRKFFEAVLFVGAEGREGGPFVGAVGREEGPLAGAEDLEDGPLARAEDLGGPLVDFICR